VREFLSGSDELRKTTNTPILTKMKTIKKSVLASAFTALAILMTSCASTGGTAGGVKPYGRDTCIVSGNKLGSMGDPVTMVYEGREVKFCCKPCVAKFNADPQKYLSSLN
jgi:YHS domain-containing protein